MSEEMFRGELALAWWARNKEGSVVHKVGCPYFTQNNGWLWATRQWTEDVDLIFNLPPWVRPCKRCFRPVDNQEGQ